MSLQAATESKRADQAVKFIYVARPERNAAAWDIMSERLDDRSFARFMSLLNNLMLKQRPGQSLT
jgi:hypothetical protein